MKLSLCIIAKNEEEMLPGLLASVKDVVDEIIVVDTGSSDRTVRIAKAAGARVIHMPWRNDFSAARNESIAHARGEWILQLDADERLAPGSGEAIKKAIVNGSFDCGLVRLHNASRADATAKEVISGAARIGEAMSLPRLMKRAPDLRYEGIVHESVMQWIRDRGNHVQFVDADIVHLGALPEIRQSRNKASRNVELLKARAVAEPDDFTAYSYLAFEALAQDKIDEASAAAEAGWKIVERGGHAPGTSVLRLTVARALVQKERGDHHGVLETVKTGERMEGLHPDLFMLRGCAREMLARRARHGSKMWRAQMTRALDAHRSALALSSTDYVQRFLVGAGSWASLTRAATILLQLGRATEARSLLESAMALKDDDTETCLALAEADIACLEPEKGLVRLEPLLGAKADAWILAALGCDRMGATDDALTFIRQAGARAENGYVAPHRKEMHLELMGLCAAYAGAPAAGPGPMGALGAIMARAPFEGVADGWDADALPVSSVVRNLLRQNRMTLLETLLTARAEATFPGIGARVAAALGEQGIEVTSDDSPAPVVVCSASMEAAVHVHRILSAHSRFTASGAVERADSAVSGDATREVFWAWTKLSALAIVSELPRATLLFVTTAEDAPWSVAELAARTVTLSYPKLLAEPVVTIARVFAELGEPADDKPLRALIESYPGRTRSLRAAPTEDRAPCAARPSTPPQSGALGVSL